MHGKLMTTDVTGFIFLGHFHSTRWTFFGSHTANKITKLQTKNPAFNSGIFYLFKEPVAP
jgi:hypothetical protein